MDDWKLRAGVVVKLEKQRNMFVSSYRVRDVVLFLRLKIILESKL